MSTRGVIAIENKDGSIDSIYSHWDNYPSGTGVTLQNHYKSEKKVRELIALGDISSLRELVNIPKGKTHSFDKPLRNVTIAYNRDRGEKTLHRNYKDFKSFKRDWKKSYNWCEYVYVFSVNTKEWTCYGIMGILYPIE